MNVKDLNLGQAIKEIHEEKGFTNKKLADFLGMLPQNVKRDVFDKKSLDTDFLRKLCVFYDYNFFRLYVDDNQIGLHQKMKATVTIELGEKIAEKSFIVSFGKNKVEIK